MAIKEGAVGASPDFDTDLQEEMKLAWAERHHHDLQAEIKDKQKAVSALKQKYDQLTSAVKEKQHELNNYNMTLETAQQNKERLLEQELLVKKLKVEKEDILRAYENLKSESQAKSTQEALQMGQVSKKLEERRADSDRALLESADYGKKERELSDVLKITQAKYDTAVSQNRRDQAELAKLRLENKTLNARVEKELASEKADRALTNQKLFDHLYETRVKCDEAKSQNTQYLDEIRKLRIENQRLNSRVAKESATEVTISGLPSKVDKLADKIDGLLHEKGRDQNEIQQVTEENRALREKNRGLEASDLFKTKEISIQNSEIQRLVSRVENLSNQLYSANKMTDEKQIEVKDLKKQMARCITDLDLADNQVRVFSCPHRDLRDIPDANHSTREKDMQIIASEMFRMHREDNDFLDGYRYVRQYILDHHRAHERVPQGRGDWSSNIKSIFHEIDNCRATSILYH